MTPHSCDIENEGKKNITECQRQKNSKKTLTPVQLAQRLTNPEQLSQKVGFM